MLTWIRPKKDRPLSDHAFSLVELSIVLVILGLLTGGILSGQSLIRASEIRAVSTEASRYLTATQAFRDKYFALPGDMANATKFWGSAAAYGTTCFAFASTTSATCDGDADARITMCSPEVSAGNCPARNSGEMFRYWQHLANAGLIEGQYTGTSGFAGGSWRDSLPGTNVPRSRVTGAGWSLEYLGVWGGDGYSFAANYGNPLIFGGGPTGDKTTGATLTPTEAWNIDTKMDDGKPATGRVLAYWWANCTTATGQTDQAALYLLTSTNKVCALNFIQVF